MREKAEAKAKAAEDGNAPAERERPPIKKPMEQMTLAEQL